MTRTWWGKMTSSASRAWELGAFGGEAASGTSHSSSVLCRVRPGPSPCKLPSPRTRHHASLHTKPHLVCRDGGGGNDAYLTDKKMVGQVFREGAEPGSLHPRLSCLLPPSIRDPCAGVSVGGQKPFYAPLSHLELAFVCFEVKVRSCYWVFF